MDHNLADGDILGRCKLANTIGNNGDSSITILDTGKTSTTEVILGIQ